MAKKITCIITDDEPYARKGLQGYVDKSNFFDLKDMCEDAVELGNLLQQQSVDLLFLDIQMPLLTGTEFLRKLANPPKVIFTTAFKEFALEGFELDVLDYLLKPISYERFLRAAQKAKEYFDLMNDQNSTAYLFVKSNGRLEKILFDEILYIQGLENYLVIHTIAKKLVVHSTLKALLMQLPVRQFLQSHKSYIVATNKISAIDGNRLFIRGHEVPISRRLKDEVLAIVINT